MSDQEAQAFIDQVMDERRTAREALYFALRSRVLTDEEMAQVCSLGNELVEPYEEPYTDADMDRRMNAALLQQFKLRRIAALTAIADVENA